MLFGQAIPFQRLPYTPLDGSGLSPQLQTPGMVFHPPMLYLGYISITIPFAFAIAALLSKRLDTDWLVAIRKRSEEHTSELQSRLHLVCRLLLEKKKKNRNYSYRQEVSSLP